jgi:periplasmic protein CpxP/Spy
MKNAILNTRLALVVPLTLCAAFSGVSVRALAAEASPTGMSRSDPAGAKMAEDRTPEARVKHLHDQLKITADQEARWNNVAQVMLANASAIDGAVKDRERMSKGMTAIDDLKSYEAIVDAHAEGIKKLATAFAPLYSSMPEGQQKNADAVFGHRTQPSRLKTHA